MTTLQQHTLGGWTPAAAAATPNPQQHALGGWAPPSPSHPAIVGGGGGGTTKMTSLPASVKPGVVTGQALVDLLDHAKENGT